MTRIPHLILAGLLLSLSLPAAAQTNAAPANVVTPAPAPREGTVGPEQLRDFALPGTRQTPAPSTNDTPRTAPAQTPRIVPPPVTSTRPAPDTARTTDAARPAPAASDRAGEAPAVATRPQGIAPEPAATSLPPATPASPLVAAPLAPITVTEPGTPTSAPSQPLWWPWLLAAALAGIALALLLRQRRRPVLAGPAGEAFERARPEPDFTPPPRAPAPPAAPAPALEAPPQAPRPAGLVTTRLRAPLGAAPPVAPPPPPPVPAAKSGGIVSTRLRGWIELDLVVREILFTSSEARLRIDILVGNGGTGNARGIALETVATNGGENQGEALAGFFARPAATTIAIPELGPLADTVLSHELVMPRGAIRAYEAGGKALFVPVIALNAAYRTASGEGRTGAAFLVGRDVPGSEKLAPVLLPDGDGRLLGLGVRRLEEAVRR